MTAQRPTTHESASAEPRPAEPAADRGGRGSLDAIFNPRSVAVLGVTQTRGTVPYDIFQNIRSGGYAGALYPVAPGKRRIDDVPAYRYVIDIKEEVDLAVIVFPASVVDKALLQCGQKMTVRLMQVGQNVRQRTIPVALEQNGVEPILIRLFEYGPIDL